MSWSDQANREMADIKAGLGLDAAEMGRAMSLMSAWANANQNGSHSIAPGGKWRNARLEFSVVGREIRSVNMDG